MIYAFDDAGLHWTHHRHDYAHHHPKQQPLPQLDYALDADAHRERSDDDDKDSNNKKAPQYADSQQPFLWRNSLEHGAQQYYPITDSDIMDTPISPQEVSPLGSELGSLPLPDTMSLIPHQQPHVLDSSSAWKEYTQLWRQLIEDSSLFNFNSFTSSSTQQGLVGLGLDAEPEPTPPLDLEISPVVHFAPEPSAGQGHADAAADGNGSTNSRSTISTLTSNTTSVELVAPKPRRLVNPAIHLAALVEEDDTNSITASRTAEEDVQERDREVMVPEEEIQEEILAIAVPAATPTAMYSGHSLEELREYMSDSEHSSSGEMVLDDQEECGFDTVSSLDLLPASSEPSSDAFNFNGWSFPREGYYYPATYQAPLPSQSQEVVAPPAPPSSGPSPLHAIVAPQYNNHSRPSQLREAMRERRAARQVLQTHSRHASLPDVQYRPAKWTVPMPAEPAPVHHYLPQQQQYARTAILAPHRRRERDASRSVDWSALASQNMILVPPPDDYTYHTAPQYAAVPLYGMQPSFYGGH